MPAPKPSRRRSSFARRKQTASRRKKSRATVAARWAAGRFGEQGLATLLLITGSMDVDTAIITLGGLDPKAIGSALAALALAGTVLVNMIVKLGITLAYARSKGVSAALALAASMVALAITMALGWFELRGAL